MTCTRRALLAGFAMVFALPVMPRPVAAMTRPLRGRSGVATVWGLAFWSRDAGDVIAPARRMPVAPVEMPDWHPEFG